MLGKTLYFIKKSKYVQTFTFELEKKIFTQTLNKPKISGRKVE